MTPVAATTETLPWRRGVAWLLFLGPFFFLSYGFANSMAARWQVSDAVVFGWERHIPFMPWTILPYWSIDLFYGLSFLLCRTALQVDRHALRLLTAQLVSVACFLLFPLRFSFARPATDGLLGGLFDALASFDQPYNQAPSLHISLLVILWVRFASASRGGLRLAVHAWAVLIAVSVLTTYQHHFIDLPSGALVGLLCLWLWPDAGPTPFASAGRSSPAARRLAGRYLLGALACAGLAGLLGDGALWLLWPAVALSLVALNYACLGPAGFQKHDGRHSLGAALLLAPYTLGAWINSRLWTRRRPAPDPIADGVWLGRMPNARDMAAGGFRALLDLTAELPAPRGPWQYAALPWLDLLPPTTAQLEQAAARLEALQAQGGPVLVCCALGYSRSASAVAAWLLLSGRSASIEAAEAMLRRARPGIVLGPAHRRALAGLPAPLETRGGA